MMDRKLIATLAILPLVAGCAALNTRAISYPPGNGSQLFVWGSQYSAGIGRENGMCAQAATTARATAASVDAAVNNSVMAALVPALAGLSQGEAARVAGGISQSVMLTNATNAQTAYANIAYFYLCQISLNRGLSPPEIMQMWSETTRIIPLVGTAGLAPGSLNPMEPTVPERTSQTGPAVPGSNIQPPPVGPNDGQGSLPGGQ
jgi:hypothetical protein